MKKIFTVIKEFKLSFSLFLFFVLFLYIFFYFNKENQIKENNSFTIHTFNSQYNITYKNFKQISQNTFYGIINKPEISNIIKNSLNKSKEEQNYYRKKLYEQFLPDYTRLISLNFKQIHFHTIDNKSFLRMHMPDVFGDDLSEIRKSVVLTNKTFKPTEGFEIGRALHGYRFVYPMFDDKLNHIGSAEVSVASKYFEDSYQNNYNVDIHLLLRKDIVENKIFKSENKNISQSDENNKYVLINEDEKEPFHFTSKNFYTNEEKKFIETKMDKAESFILNKNDLIIYFKPIENLENIKNCSYMVLYSKSNYIKELNYNYKVICTALFLSIIIFLFTIYHKYEEKIREEEKKKLYNQQSKLISMGEMINNIAHQWRQPLSVISTAASGIQLQNEYGILEKSTISESMNLIVEQTQSLSQTIEDFRNFNLINKEKQPILIKKTILDTLKIFEITISQQNITIINNIEDNLIVTYPEDFKQVIIILIKNAIEAIKSDGLILIDSKIIDNSIKIEIQDSGGGIKNEFLPKIFEPYYTTKHQSMGTGVGLFAVFEMVTNKLNGTIRVKNNEFNYKFKNYKGALFTINLNEENK